MTMSVNPDLAGVQARWIAAWPDRKLIWLLQAMVAEPERARAAWRSWLDTSTFDAAPFTEIRLMATLSARLGQIDPDFPDQAKVSGFRRYVFAHTHQRIKSTLPMLRVLSEAGIRMMLIKGAARLAMEPTIAAERFMADIDVLIGRADWARAMEIGRRQGWTYLPPPAVVAAMNLAGLDDIYPFRHSVDFSDRPAPSYGRLDLHHHARHVNRMPGDDDHIWANAVPITYLGLDVLVPSPTDQLLITLTHGLRRSQRNPAGEWALDAAVAIQRSAIDWDRLLRDTLDTLTQAPVGAALLLLQRELDLPVPERVVAALGKAVDSTLLDELDFLATTSYSAIRIKEPGRVLAARDAAVARARAALRRGGAQTGVQARPWPPVLPPVGAPAVLEAGKPHVFPLPSPLRPNDRLTLEIQCRVTDNRNGAYLVLHCPYLVLDQLALPRTKRMGHSRSFWTVVQFDPALFIAGEMGVLQIRLHGRATVEQVRVRWRRSLAMAHLGHFLGRVRSRLLRTLRRPPAAPRQLTGSS